MSDLKPLKVYLCDLTYDTVKLVSDTIPVNIGYIGSYAKKMHGNSIEVSLFKYPDTTIKAIKKNPPDVLGLSNYSWNSLLSEHVAKVAKSKNPKVVTVQGGPNFPHESDQQLEFLKRRPNTNFHIEFEGEASFSNLLDRVLKDRRGEQELFNSPIGGCVFVDPNKNNSLVKGLRPPRIKFLDDIPSPYLNGMLDHFFDGRLSPFIETNRGCPFKCSFCHTGADYFQKVHMFSLERILVELEYIGQRAAKKKNTVLHLADVNFGMFPRDKNICKALVNTRKKYHWPLSLITTTGKNNKERVIEATSILGNIFQVGMSVQSMDEKVLSNIKRSNIKLDHYVEVSKYARKHGTTLCSELIIGLPGETKKSFIEGVKKVINAGTDRIVIWTLMMLNGTEFKNPEYRAKYKMKGKYRIVPLDIGEYDGVKVLDYEEVCVENIDMSFQDYLGLRQFAFVIENVFNNQLFEVFFRYATTLGVSKFDYLLRIFNNISKAPKKIVEIFDAFAEETKSELWDSDSELVQYYQKDENYQKLIRGDAGGNLIYKYKAMGLATAINEWTQYLSNLLEDIVNEKREKSAEQSFENNKSKKEIYNLTKYHKNRMWKILDDTSNEQNVTMDSEYDFLSWMKEEEPQPLSSYHLKNPVRYFFRYSEEQKRERDDQFRRYGTDVNGISRIAVRVRIENWLRNVGTNPNFV